MGDAPQAPDAPGTGDEVAHLIEERDQLAAEVERLSGPRRSRLRGFAAGAFTLLACVSLLVATLGLWANRNALDTDTFTSRVAPLASDPAVQDALTFTLTTQVMQLIDPQKYFEEALPDRADILAVPLTGVVRDFVNGKVGEFVRSDTFADLWATVVERAHAASVAVLKGEGTAAISTAGGRVTLNLVPLINRVLAEISSVSPDIFGRNVDIPQLSVDMVPAEAQAALSEALGVDLSDGFGTITVYDDDALGAAQDGLKLFDAVFTASVVGTVLFAGLALALSQRRRRTALQLTVGAAVVLVLVRRVVLRLAGDVVAQVPTPRGAAAVEATLQAFTDPLLNSSAVVLWVLAALLAVLVLTGPYGWVVRLRHGVVGLARGGVGAATAAANSDTTVSWVREHASALQVAGGAAFVGVLWWTELSWLGLLLVAGVIGAFEVWVHRIGSEPVEGDGGPPLAPSVT